MSLIGQNTPTYSMNSAAPSGRGLLQTRQYDNFGHLFVHEWPFILTPVVLVVLLFVVLIAGLNP
jgi:hypothetical protein